MHKQEQALAARSTLQAGQSAYPLASIVYMSESTIFVLLLYSAKMTL